MAKLLVVTYNDGHPGLNLVPLDPVLYLSRTMFPELRKCKYAEITQDLPGTIVQKIQILREKFDFLLLLDNKRKFLFNQAELQNFIEQNRDKLLISRLQGRENNIQDGLLVAKNMDSSCLLVNLKLLRDYDLIPEQRVGNVFFPFFSRIYYKHYKDILVTKIPGVEVQHFRVNLLV